MDRASEMSSADLIATVHAIARERGIVLDRAQQRAMQSLQRLYNELTHTPSAWLRLFARSRPVRGIYLWGAVGRGKSFLMDELYRLIPIERKQRVHFHRFMQSVHHRLRGWQGHGRSAAHDRSSHRRPLACFVSTSFTLRISAMPC